MLVFPVVKTEVLDRVLFLFELLNNPDEKSMSTEFQVSWVMDFTHLELLSLYPESQAVH
jgi:hypothetical protein